jgi:ABC-type lipoprotein release transport system permease subunit
MGPRPNDPPQRHLRFTVIGVLEAKMQEGDSDENRQIYIPFSTMSDIKTPSTSTASG